MSSAITVGSPGAGDPPTRRRGARLVATLVILIIAIGTMLAGASPAHAGSHGVGYDIGEGWLGSYSTDSDGRQAYCIDLGMNAPFSPTSEPQTITSLDSLSRQQIAELNYVLARWGQSGDPTVTAAVALYVWSVGDPGVYNSHGMSGDDYYVARAPAGVRGTILSNLATMRAEAPVNAVVDPSLSLAIDMADQYAGTLTVAANPSHLQGTVNLTGAVFGNGSSSRTVGAGQFGITGTPADGAPSYQIGASMSVSGDGYGAKLSLYTSAGDEQRIIASVAGSPASLSASAQTPVIDLDFQPVIATQVSSRYVTEGDAFVDQLEVTLTKGTWTRLGGSRIPIAAEGTLYGPFDQQPREADSPPLGAPVAGVEQVTLTGAGSYTSPGMIEAPSSGFYTWVWKITKEDQGEYAQYLTGSFTDRFGRVAESSVTPFQPQAVSTADQHLAVAGDPLTDTIVVSSGNGPWLRVDGEPIPVVFEGTLYRVPGVRPPTESATINPDAVPIGTVTITATGPGRYIAPMVVAPAGGFVTWVWEMKKASQPDWVRPYLADDWADRYGIPVESTSVRWPLHTSSLLREYNVHPGGRAFDVVTVTGFPADHGDFHGDGYWQADTDEVTHVVYGPFATDTVLTDDLDLSTAPVLTRLTTPARNGVYQLGYTDSDRITPTEPGYYVVVSSFAGDDRVRPYTSSPADVLERFYVPPPTPPVIPVTVITQATPEAQVGEPFEDLALVQGDVPAGSTLVFRAYGPQPPDEAPVCEEPFYVSEPIAVTQAGVYRSGTTTTTDTGAVYWIETLYDSDEEVLAEGVCGAPGETTVVTAQPQPLAVTTKATPEVELGKPATDTATVTGTVPEGAALTFETYLQGGDEPTCTADELVQTTEPIPLDGAGEYISESVVFETIGTYYWVETVYDIEGAELTRGVCGAPGETTLVSEKPSPTPTPPAPLPGELAYTGGGDWPLPFGIGAGILLLAGFGVLAFGRRLAIYRERNGYVREEDLENGALDDLGSLDHDDEG
ncbi:hypothetical protein FM104_11610 [Microbacterium esteraromaticum]|uniref:Uncharacterized protein n=1 Tax=Microbacterium esteraromaticum TaxID=57043 RepID=A0A1R4KBP0_9MICO|nr:hypothetical protein [Microbacterium esteraromaticum]SJN41740.1 hypothetical protein FM104_11610 [Microbacterium esteraromaticum]